MQISKREKLATAADCGVNYTSIAFQLNGVRDYSIHVAFSSSTLNGNLSLEASDDPDLTEANWVPIDNSSQDITTGLPHLWNVLWAQYEFVRFVWTYTSGTGTLDAWMVLKFNDR